MSILYNIRRHLARLVRKPRSRGFGVQSPWAYRFVRTVAMGREGGRGVMAFLGRLRAFCPKGQLLTVTLPTSSETLEVLLTASGEQSALAVLGIHGSREAKTQWQQLLADERTGVSFDLFDCGVVFFDRKMFKRTYKINYR